MDAVAFTLVFIVFEDRSGLIFIDVDPVADNAFIAVVGAARGGAAKEQAMHNFLILDMQREEPGYAMAHTAEQGIQCFGLGDGARKSIKNESSRFRVCLYFVAQHPNGDRIGHQFAFCDIGLGLQTERCVVAHLIAEEVSRADVDEVVFLYQFGCLGAFTGTRRAEEYQICHHK